VDTAFWIARTFPRDAHHDAAKLWSECCRQHPLVTTDSVLGEVGAFFAGKGAQLRQAAARLVSAIEGGPRSRRGSAFRARGFAWPSRRDTSARGFHSRLRAQSGVACLHAL
jgi:hypothetical protein